MSTLNKGCFVNKVPRGRRQRYLANLIHIREDFMVMSYIVIRTRFHSSLSKPALERYWAVGGVYSYIQVLPTNFF